MSEKATPTDAPIAISEGRLLLVPMLSGLAFALFGAAVDDPVAAFHGLLRILVVRDTLITDYVGVGGIGGAFLNAGVLTMLTCAIYARSGAKIGGAAMAAIFLTLGFALFGKNLLNVWFIVAGVWLYAKFKREPFANHINTAFFGAALAPIFTEVLFSSTLPLAARVPLAVATAVLAGFVLAPAAAQLFKAHMGFSLYNMGFTAGIIGTLIVAVYKSYGFVPDPVFIWTRGNNLLFAVALYAFLAGLAATGLWFDRNALRRLPALMRLSGQAPTDFIERCGAGAALVNMGLAGAVGVTYVLLIGGDLNGPTIGAILTIVGFAAFGKHPRNIVPIMAGVFIGSLFKPWNIADPTVVLAALFGTTLAPIAGRFGWYWGIVAGFIHSSAAQSVGVLHGGLNLYNNGFAAGIVASALAPVILALRSPDEGKDEPEG